MGTTSDKLLYLQDTKSAIKDAIVAKGVTVPTGTTFRDYATKIGSITTGSSGSEIADTWVRPSQWLALPNNVDGVQKVSILNAIFDTDSEYVALVNSGTGAGAYTVDWGDGTSNNYTAGTTAEHKYDYSNANLNSDTVTNYGYKQCIITITPQAGQNLVVVTLNMYHSSVGSGSTSYNLSSGFLDINCNLPYGNPRIGSNGVTGTTYVKHTLLERVSIGECSTFFTNASYLFYNCYVLQSVSIKDTSNVTTFASMHYNNYALQKMPTYTFRSDWVDVSNMFYNCYSLREIYPLVITLTSNAIASMFLGCKSIRYIDLTINSNINYSLSSICNGCLSLDEFKLTQSGTGKITSISNAFIYTRLKESPAMDTSLCTTFANAFQFCDRLTNLYAYNYASATTLSNMLDGCYSLKSVPNFNITASCTNLSYLCQNCWSLEKAPTFSNSSGVTNIAGMISYCKSLTNIPSYVFGTVTTTNANAFLSNCDSLKILPSITIGSSYTANTNFILNTYSLKRMLMPLRFTFSVANAKMSATALNEMYSILPAVNGQILTVTGNYGSPYPYGAYGTLTYGSNVITGISNTSSISVGQFVTVGTTTSSNTTCTFTDGGDLVTKTAHGLVDGNIVAFNIVTTTTGITAKTIYYVVNATTDTFQVSDTIGGAPLALINNGTGSYLTPAFVVSIVPNTSVTLSTPCPVSGSYTMYFHNNINKIYLAIMKGWTVTF